MNDEDRLVDLHRRNDWIERRLAGIDKHGRRESISRAEQSEKASLQAELNRLIAEIEEIESGLHD